MTTGSWPYFPRQCPRCFYFQAASPSYIDDSGYEVLGFCRHPRIAMELFQTQRLHLSESNDCPMFMAEGGRRSA
jgi:hypothetical protein